MSDGVVLHAVGDLGFCGRIADRLDGEDPLEHVRETLSAGDLLFGNFEIPMSGGATISPHESARLEAPPDAATHVARAGFDVVSLANNHVMDFGREGLEATLGALREAGVEVVGAGRTLAEARQPVILDRRGLRTGFLAYAVPFDGTATERSAGAAPLDLGVIREDLSRLRARADVVVVSAHFGMMYLEHPTPEDMDLAREIVAAGANLVLGHHPHVLQGIERLGSSAIAYSLGEMLFDPRAGHYYAEVARERRRHAAVFRFRLERRAAVPLDPVPTLAGDDLFPRPLEGDAARADQDRIEELSRALVDPEFRSRFWRYAGERLMAYQMTGLAHSLASGRWLHLLGRLHRIRPRHLRLVAGWLRARFAPPRGETS